MGDKMIKNKQWLKLATSKKEGSALGQPFYEADYAFAMDGLRLHITKLDKIPPLITSLMVKLHQEEIIASFLVNPQFLIDALQGFENEVTIRVYPKHIVLLAEEDEHKSAYIMLYSKTTGENDKNETS
jgi:hypothetical protein